MKNILLGTLALLLGASQGLRTNNNSNMQKLVESLSQTSLESELSTEQKGYRCTTAITRWKNSKDDYRKIIKANKANWRDTGFPSGSKEALYWTSFQDKSSTLENMPAPKWARISSVFPSYKLFGQGGLQHDVAQGSIGDCYFLSAISSATEESEQFQKNFVIKNVNRPGIYAFNVYVRGLPSIVTIDDNLPFLYLEEKYLYFAQPGWGGSLWAPLLEKSFAKVHGNYDNLNGGFPSEGFKYLTNAPTSTYDLAGDNGLSVDAFWEVIDDADSDKYMINVWTGGGPDGQGD